jgi:hypothetical protein
MRMTAPACGRLSVRLPGEAGIMITDDMQVNMQMSLQTKGGLVRIVLAYFQTYANR